MFSFEKLQVYQKGLDLTSEIFALTNDWPKAYLYDVTTQIRRATLSVPSNIAEGSSRSKKDFSRFIDIARGSCYECVPLLEVAERQGLLGRGKKDQLYEKLNEIARMLNGLKRSL